MVAASNPLAARVRSVEETVAAIQATATKTIRPTKTPKKKKKKKVRFDLSAADEVKAHLRQAEAETALGRAREERICRWRKEEEAYPRDQVPEELPEPEIRGGTTALG